MKSLEHLSIEKSTLESNLQLLVKENLTTKELKEEKEIELSMLESEIKELDKSISELKSQIEVAANEYSYKKENKLFNKVIAANLIPCLSIGALFIVTGNSHVIANFGAFSAFFTGIPTLFACTGIYMADLKNIRKENKEEYLFTDEYKPLDEELKSLENKRLNAKDKVRELKLEINKLKTSIHNNGYQIVSIKNRLSDINYTIRTGKNVIEQVPVENIKIIK